MTKVTERLAGAALSLVVLTLAAAPGRAETLFKIVTVKDEIVVGLNAVELKEYGGDAAGLAKAIAANGALTLWLYGVGQKDGARFVGPRAKIGVLANGSLRVEPYTQPFPVLPHE